MSVAAVFSSAVWVGIVTACSGTGALVLVFRQATERSRWRWLQAVTVALCLLFVVSVSVRFVRLAG